MPLATLNSIKIDRIDNFSLTDINFIEVFDDFKTWNRQKREYSMIFKDV